MRNTLLVETLKWLNPEDMSELALFVSSEFHNRGKWRHDVLRLFECIHRAYPEFEEEAISRKYIYSVVFPDAPVIASKLEKLTSELYKIVKDFLIWKQYQQPERQFDRALDWARVVRNTSEVEKTELVFNRIEKDFFKKQPVSAAYFFQKFQLEYERMDWLNRLNKGREDVNIGTTINSLYIFFEIYRIDLLNMLLLQQKVATIELPELIRSNLDTHVHIIPSSENIILNITRKIHSILQQPVPTVAEFEDLMAALRAHETDIAPDTLKNYYAYLRNICILLINAGHENMQPVMFQLMQDNLERGYLYFEGKLHTNVLGSITRMAILTGHVEWGLECIERHKDRIFGDIETSDYYLINKALCLFELRRYEEALELLPQSSPNIQYHLIARRLEILCYYELKSDLLTFKMEAFKVYIWRASEKFLSEPLKEANKAFINLLIQLVAIPPGDKDKLERLARRIREKSQVAEMRWLLSKVE